MNYALNGFLKYGITRVLKYQQFEKIVNDRENYLTRVDNEQLKIP
jgi:hypothetical protein